MPVCAGAYSGLLVIGGGGDMGAHTADRIAVGGSILNFQPFNGIGVIAGPSLGGIVKKSRVKACAAAGTGLKEHLGERGIQLFIQMIHSEDIAVDTSPLPVGRKGGGPALRDAAVHIPLYIGHLSASQNIRHHLVNRVYHFGLEKSSTYWYRPWDCGLPGTERIQSGCSR